jgi:hypothetical protein
MIKGLLDKAKIKSLADHKQALETLVSKLNASGDKIACLLVTSRRGAM